MNLSRLQSWLLATGLCLCAVVFLAACREDDGSWSPPYRQDFADLTTDATGAASAMVLDTDARLSLTSPVTGLRPDTVYRIRALYTDEGNGHAHLTDFVPLLALDVRQLAAHLVKADPLEPVSCTRSGHYLNLCLSLRGTNEGIHAFGCHQTDYVRHDDGSRTLHALLVHHQNNDPAHYSRPVYLSIRLSPLANLLQSGRDSMALHIVSFNGERVYRFAYTE